MDFEGFKIEAGLPDDEVAALGLDDVRETYKGFPIVSVGWQHPSHASRTDSFYVQTPAGVVGWVPWLGSQIVWPWEAAWIQDLRQGHVSRFKDVKK